MQKKLLFIVILCCSSLTMHAQTDIDALFKQAYYYYNAANYKAAIPLYTKLTKLQPDNPNIFYDLGICYYSLAAYQNSYTAFKKSYEIAIANPYTPTFITLGALNELIHLQLYYFIQPDSALAFCKLYYAYLQDKNVITYIKKALGIKEMLSQGYKPILAANKEMLSSDAGTTYFYAPKHIKQLTKGITKVWVVNLDTDTTSSNVMSGDNTSLTFSGVVSSFVPKFSKHEYKYDCNSESICLLQYINYVGSASVDSYVFPPAELVNRSVIPGSVGEGISNFFCQKKYLKNK